MGVGKAGQAPVSVDRPLVMSHHSQLAHMRFNGSSGKKNIQNQKAIDTNSCHGFA